VPVDRNLARSYHEQAFLGGYPQALTWKGMVYLHGDGVAVDYGRAMTLFRTAFYAGDVLAPNEIGFMYQHGLGRKPNLAVAWCWYDYAVIGGYDGSNKHLQELAATVVTTPQNCDVVVRPDYRDQ
jgi:TPR repeat protein